MGVQGGSLELQGGPKEPAWSFKGTLEGAYKDKRKSKRKHLDLYKLFQTNSLPFNCFPGIYIYIYIYIRTSGIPPPMGLRLVRADG